MLNRFEVLIELIKIYTENQLRLIALIINDIYKEFINPNNKGLQTDRKQVLSFASVSSR